MSETTSEPKVLLLVEGRDDENFFSALRRSLGISEDVLKIENYGGKPKLRARFAFLPDSIEKIRTIAVIRDADESSDSAANSVSDAFSIYWKSPPSDDTPIAMSHLKDSAIGEEGFLEGFRNTEFRLAMFILPGDGAKGELEDLVLKSLEDVERLACVDKYVACLEKSGSKVKKLAKSKLYSYFASLDEPNGKLGEALTQKFVPIDSAIFDPCKQFLRDITASI